MPVLRSSVNDVTSHCHYGGLGRGITSTIGWFSGSGRFRNIQNATTMSYLVGPASGALVAGGVYYGFSNLISTRTEQHRRDLHALSVRLTEHPTLVQAPPSAAARITQAPFTTMMQGKWNQELANLFAGFNNMDRRVVDWAHKMLYGDNKQS